MINQCMGTRQKLTVSVRFPEITLYIYIFIYLKILSLSMFWGTVKFLYRLFTLLESSLPENM